MNEIITKIIGEVVIYGGGSAAIAYGIFRFLGQKWLENKFAQNLVLSRYYFDYKIDHSTACFIFNLYEDKEGFYETSIRLESALSE